MRHLNVRNFVRMITLILARITWVQFTRFLKEAVTNWWFWPLSLSILIIGGVVVSLAVDWAQGKPMLAGVKRAWPLNGRKREDEVSNNINEKSQTVSPLIQNDNKPQEPVKAALMSLMGKFAAKNPAEFELMILEPIAIPEEGSPPRHPQQ